MDWKEWRRAGLGASDAPIVMGVSPWKTRYQLWEEKAGLNSKNEDDGNWATRRGQDMEKVARADYELMFNRDMPVAFVEHKDFPFIRASLDGWNADEGIVLEIKCPGKDDHETAKQGRVPEKYWPQVQHQILASGAKCVHYYSYDGQKGVLVEVAPDRDYIDNLFLNLCSFWKLVQTKTPPDLVDKDFKKIRDKEAVALAERWRAAKLAADAAAAEEDALKKELIAKCGDIPRALVGDVEVSKVFRSGSVDYSKIPALQGVNLEPFRKKGSTYSMVKVRKLKE